MNCFQGVKRPAVASSLSKNNSQSADHRMLGIFGYRTLFWVLIMLLTLRIIYLSFCDNERWEEFTYIEMLGFLYKNPNIGIKALSEDSLRCGKMVTTNLWDWTKQRLGLSK